MQTECALNVDAKTSLSDMLDIKEHKKTTISPLAERCKLLFYHRITKYFLTL